MKYQSLISSIDETHQTLQQSAVKAVNSHITLRNWLIGYYIVAFEQNGEDRAKYGAKLFYNLANELKSRNIKTNERDLRGCRSFYTTYSLFIDFMDYLPAYKQLSKSILPIRGSVTPESQIPILRSLTQKSENPIRESATPKLQHTEIEEDETYYTQIFTQISYTHFVELIKIKEPTKRKFYELSVIKNTLSVRELERQIATLTYERVGLSANTDLAFPEYLSKKHINSELQISISFNVSREHKKIPYIIEKSMMKSYKKTKLHKKLLPKQLNQNEKFYNSIIFTINNL